jgi:hypothetical protein
LSHEDQRVIEQHVIQARCSPCEMGIIAHQTVVRP